MKKCCKLKYQSSFELIFNWFLTLRTLSIKSNPLSSNPCCPKYAKNLPGQHPISITLFIWLLELFIKTTHAEWIINAAKTTNEYWIEIWAQNYILRNEYIAYWFDTSLRNTQNWWILWDISIIQSFSYISSRFSELIESDSWFSDFAKGLFIRKWYNYDAFYSILRFIRNLSVHWSTNKDYVLKEDDFKDWKSYQIKKNISVIELNLIIVGNLHQLNIKINVNELCEWYNISNIFDWYNMFMFIELCMNIVAGFKNNPA